MNIDDILSRYSPEKLELLIKELIEKSNPLWSYDYKGYVINREHAESFIIGVPNQKDSVLVKNKVLDNILDTSQNVSFNSTSMTDRIVVYRMEATAPIYAVSNMGLYEEKNDRSNISHDIDANWELRMEREDFSIHPAEKEDHSLEYWVLGLIYGFVKFDKGTYQVKSPKQGKAIKKYWVELGEYRDDAFNQFKYLKFQEEVKDLIDSEITKMGKTENENLILKVTGDEDTYINDYSQRNFEMEDLEDKKMKPVLDLFESEIDFVFKVLGKN